MKLKIKVTKEILERSMWCSTDAANEGEKGVMGNCAIAVACREIFPKCFVNSDTISTGSFIIPLPYIAMNLIDEFDNLSHRPLKRLLMQPLEFEVELPDKLIDSIDIDEVREILKESETLELVEA